jgi:hypothetical protein
VSVDAIRRDGHLGARVTDRISITIPADGRFRQVSTLVLGGVGTRLNLPYERMDDLQLAVLSLLEVVDGDGATVDIDAGDDGIAVSVGPLRSGAGTDASLERVVKPLVDGVEPAERDGGEWITLRLASAPQRSAG